MEPQDVLEAKQTYRNIYDADAVVLGIYGKFSGLAERYIVLNELRGDLLDVTPNANEYLRQINLHNVSVDNPYADPRPFYEIIINCNDAIKNFGIMREKKILDENQYYQRYTEVGLLRTWLYLQLGIHYGSVPYVTDALDNVNDLQDETKFPKLSFDQLLDQLISFTEAIPKVYLNQNTSSASPTLIMAMNSYSVKDGVFKFFIHRKSLLGDINLWKGNYEKAAAYYKEVMELGTTNTSNNDQNIEIYDTYRVSNDNSGKNTLLTIGTNNPWPTIFTNALDERETNRERMWTLPLNKDFAPGNPFIKLFSSTGNYLLKPSDLAIQKWDDQVRLDGGLRDRRGLNASYWLNAGKPEVYKFVAKYDITKPFETTGIWLLYRAAVLHLRYAEAANRAGYSELAGVIVNDGFADKGVTYANNPTPFDFNAFKGTVNGNWYRNIGIRGRAVDRNVAFDQNNLMIDTEDKIIEEEALESAFEGYRWPDLLRIALRRKATDPNYLANKIGAKFDASNNGEGAAVRARLTDEKNWYLPFKWK
ncbi:RagB/SusD family nutrient uptake outer membrane protein [Pelobium manganitolerans]|uniref:RagB/SusD family nutrient uptake outer membrane protein n=1 Tax=Pelobium manganitolerans TaxID=1842495 RepID=UPI003FA37264